MRPLITKGWHWWACQCSCFAGRCKRFLEETALQLSVCHPEQSHMRSVHSVILPQIKTSVLRGAGDPSTVEQSFVKVMFNERETNAWSRSVTNESICAIVMKLGKQNRLDSSGFPLSSCICNSSLAFMCGCEWHRFPLGMEGLGPGATASIHRELAVKSVFYRHTGKDCS